LIIGAGSTSHVPQDALVEVAELIQNSELVAIDGACHNVHSAKQAEFITTLREFLSASAPGA
jgi:pimeloyl-ACP methyl ester carboxylesterase